MNSELLINAQQGLGPGNGLADLGRKFKGIELRRCRPPYRQRITGSGGFARRPKPAIAGNGIMERGILPDDFIEPDKCGEIEP